MKLSEEQHRSYRANGFHFPLDVVDVEQAALHNAQLEMERKKREVYDTA